MSTTLIKIKHCQIPDKVIFECQVPDEIENKIKYAVETAVRRGKSLAYANLSHVNLRGANLYHANLYRAYLQYTNLQGSDLQCSDLQYTTIQGSDLQGSDLRYAKFHETNIDGELVSKTPTLIVGLHWSVFITEGYMRIGCQRHTHEEWKSFNDHQISKMDDNALEFWNRYSVVLLSMCDIQSK